MRSETALLTLTKSDVTIKRCLTSMEPLQLLFSARNFLPADVNRVPLRVFMAGEKPKAQFHIFYLRLVKLFIQTNPVLFEA